MENIREIEQLKSVFERHITGIHYLSEKRVTLDITPDFIVNIAGELYHELQFRFIIASALETKKGIEIYYHFSKDVQGLIVNLHVTLSRKNPEIISLTSKFEAANWIEREMHELLGINFLNHPNLEKLISEGNWAEGVFPYRKTEPEKKQ